MIVGADKLEPALKFTVAALRFAVPAPVTVEPELKLNAGLAEKLRLAPEATVKPAASVPPPENAKVATLAATVPPVLLLKSTETVLVVPAVFSKVPVLLNTPFGAVD